MRRLRERGRWGSELGNGMEAAATSMLSVGKAVQVQATYRRLLEAVLALSPCPEEPKKTSIHLVNQAGFAGVHPSKTYLYLNLRNAGPDLHPMWDDKHRRPRYTEGSPLANALLEGRLISATTPPPPSRPAEPDHLGGWAVSIGGIGCSARRYRRR